MENESEVKEQIYHETVKFIGIENNFTVYEIML